MMKARATSRLSILRWRLNPTASALWQLVGLQACQGLEIRLDWIEAGQDWKPNLQREGEYHDKLQELLGSCRPTAIIIGIERSEVGQIVEAVSILRQLCNRLPLANENPHDTPTGSPFLIGWFPEADREISRILRELGLDLVLSHASQLKPVVAKIIRYGSYSDRL
jgi:hypothetical protein